VCTALAAAQDLSTAALVARRAGLRALAKRTARRVAYDSLLDENERKQARQVENRPDALLSGMKAVAAARQISQVLNAESKSDDTAVAAAVGTIRTGPGPGAVASDFLQEQQQQQQQPTPSNDDHIMYSVD
jgi:hypothetical protein